MKTRILPLLLSLLFTIPSYSTIVFSENFDGVANQMSSSSSGSNSWALNTALQFSGTRSDSAAVSTGDTLFLTSNAFSTSGFNFVVLRFQQICKVDFFDRAIIEVSSNNGSTWTQLSATEYLGSAFLNNGSFSAVSYPTWNAANPNAVPLNSWWQAESFDLTTLLANSSQAMIRFVLIDADNNGSRGNYGWLLDDIEVDASPCELIPPTIVQQGTIFQGNVYQQGPFDIEADIQDASGISSTTLEYTLNGGALQTLTMNNIGGSIYSATIPAAVVGDTICYTIVATDNSGCTNVANEPANGCRGFRVQNTPPPSCVGNPVSVFPYVEDFSSFTPGNGSSTVGALNNNWENDAVNDTHDWWVLNRNTNSTATGPNGDHTTGSGNYMFIESSGGFNNQIAMLNTPCYDFTSMSAPKFTFWYHMNGATMGDLHLDIFANGGWILDIMPVISGSQGNAWIEREVDLSAYSTQIVKLRFRGVTGTSFTSDIAIDDIRIVEPAADEIELVSIVSPTSSGCHSSIGEFLTVRLRNNGAANQMEIPMAYQVNNGAIVRDTARFGLMVGMEANYTFQQTVNMSLPITYTFNVWLEKATDANPLNDTILNNSVISVAAITNFPDTSDFDDFIPGAPGTFANGWTNLTNDSHDWYVSTGTTPSQATGPTGDHTSGNGNYLYTEASNFNNTTAEVSSPCYELFGTANPQLSFWYHMSGATMGDLHLDLQINGFVVQDVIAPIIGDQGPNWIKDSLDLSPYPGTVKLIFRGEVGTSFTSDICIDDIIVYENPITSIDEVANTSLKVMAFPNPASDQLNFVFDAKGITSGRLQLTDAQGRLVHEEPISQSEGQISIDVSAWAKGVYFYSFNGEERLSTGKVIVR